MINDVEKRQIYRFLLSLITEVHEILNDFDSDREWTPREWNPSPLPCQYSANRKLRERKPLQREKNPVKRKKLDVKVGD